MPLAGLAVSSDPRDVLVTYALGSCLGITLYDAEAGVGGMLHVMLPSSSIDASASPEKPCKYVDTGLPLLFEECYRAGARRERLIVKVAGGAASGTQPDFFEIGQRNVTALRRLLWRNQILLHRHATGGTESRTMSLEVATGRVTLTVAGKRRPL